MSFSANGKLLWDSDQFAKPSANAQEVTSVYARHMVDMAGIKEQPSTGHLEILDNACGVGVVTNVLQEAMRMRSPDSFEVTAMDLADAMVATAKDTVQKQGWKNTHVLKGDAQDTKLPSNHFTHVFTNFGPMLFPEPSKAISEWRRMLKSGGVCAFTTWQQVGWIEDVTAAMRSMPHLPALPEKIDMANTLKTGRWDSEDFIRSIMGEHGFTDIDVRAIPNTTTAKSLEELRPILNACVTLFVKLLWTQKQQDEFDTATLREQIEAWFKEKYGAGPIEWYWIALVTTSVKPN